MPVAGKSEGGEMGKASVIHVIFRTSCWIFGSRTAIPRTEIVACLASVVDLRLLGRTLEWLFP